MLQVCVVKCRIAVMCFSLGISEAHFKLWGKWQVYKHEDSCELIDVKIFLAFKEGSSKMM
jgi:hypothetical protein